jgi:hypothetical protein
VASQASPVATLHSAHHGSNGDDDLPTVYLFLIDALDKGFERGESHGRATTWSEAI